MRRTFRTGAKDDPTLFEYDLSTKRVIIDAEMGMFISDVLDFANHMRREHGIGLDLTPGPIVALEDRERIEFIRRAAIALHERGFCNRAWEDAEALWRAKPEGL